MLALLALIALLACHDPSVTERTVAQTRARVDALRAYTLDLRLQALDQALGSCGGTDCEPVYREACGLYGPGRQVLARHVDDPKALCRKLLAAQ